MVNWNLYGKNRKHIFFEELEPQALKDKLTRYRRVLGKEFSIADLLVLEDIRVKALIAEAINDAPEFLIDQIYKGWEEDGIGSIRGSFQRIADGIGGIAGGVEGIAEGMEGITEGLNDIALPLAEKDFC